MAAPSSSPGRRPCPDGSTAMAARHWSRLLGHHPPGLHSDVPALRRRPTRHAQRHSFFKGQFGVYFKSGRESSFDPDAPWLYAYLAQTGTLPPGTKSIHLLADGPLAVSLGGNAIALSDLGKQHFTGDVSAFAGQTLELRITDTTTSFAPGLYLDGIRFSSTPLPEPGAVPLALAGSGCWACSVRARPKGDLPERAHPPDPLRGHHRLSPP